MSYTVVNEILDVSKGIRGDFWSRFPGLESKLCILFEEKKAKNQLEPIRWMIQESYWDEQE